MNRQFSILVVDNEEVVRFVLSSLISGEGYNAETATDGVELPGIALKTLYAMIRHFQIKT